VYSEDIMIKLNDREIKLNRDQYLELGSDYNILSDMYEMKLGHELRLLGDDYILKFMDNQSLEIFIGYIYKQYLRGI
jgi:hypothetical protein|tara:strand:- start:150 stop:380 length:231 start_codon:yes stop_codon:yes gene_type:complete